MPFYITLEIKNNTDKPFDSWYFAFEFFKGGYSLGRTGGSGVYGSDVTIQPAAKAKLDMSSSEVPDEVQVKFPKPGWSPITLKLR